MPPPPCQNHPHISSPVAFPSYAALQFFSKPSAPRDQSFIRGPTSGKRLLHNVETCLLKHCTVKSPNVQDTPDTPPFVEQNRPQIPSPGEELCPGDNTGKNVQMQETDPRITDIGTGDTLFHFIKTT